MWLAVSMRNKLNMSSVAIILLQLTRIAFLDSPSFAGNGINSELKQMLNDIDRLCSSHDYDAAVPIAAAAVAKYPTSYDARVLRARVNMGMEEDEKAIPDFLWALKQNPNDCQVAEDLSNAYGFLGKNDLALKYIDISINGRPPSAEKSNGYMKKKDILKRMNRNLEAEKCVSQALSAFHQPHWYFERMKLEVLNSHWPGAIEDAAHILPVMPKFRQRILQLRAQSFLGLKKYGEAERDLNAALQMTPDSRELHQDRLILYKLAGKKDLAQKEAKLINGLGESL